MKLEVGDIVLYKGKSILSKCVQLVTRSKYSHVAMLISDRHIIEADWYKKSNIVEFKFNPEIMEIYRFKEGLSEDQKISLVKDSYDFLNKDYDFMQIFGYLIRYLTGNENKSFNNPNKIICSELIDRAYANINIELVENRDVGDVTPDDIAKSKKIVGLVKNCINRY